MLTAFKEAMDEIPCKWIRFYRFTNLKKTLAVIGLVNIFGLSTIIINNNNNYNNNDNNNNKNNDNNNNNKYNNSNFFLSLKSQVLKLIRKTIPKTNKMKININR